MSDLKTIVGIRETKSKTTGKPYFNYYFMEDFTDYEKESAEQCVGKKVAFESSPLRFDVQVGDKVKCYYEKGYQDKAMLAEMIVKEKGKLSEGSAK